MYRVLAPLALLCLAVSSFAAETPAPAFPLWDGHESIAHYAERTNLPPTMSLDLGNFVKLEFVLIPAGKFIMGAPEPKPVDEYGFHKKIVVGKAVFAVGMGVLLVLVGTVIIRAIRKKRRFQYSLLRFMGMIFALSVAVLGGMHWWFSAHTLAQAQAEYSAALARYQRSYDWEKPAHEVTLTRPFYMSKFKVTQEQYTQVMGTNPSNFKGPNLPVEMVSWEDAQEFCRKVNERTAGVPPALASAAETAAVRKWAVRLHTEAEWEFACRAGTTTTYYSGDTEADLACVAWYFANSGGKTHPVGQKEPNAFGLYDMLGNVWEWCQDWQDLYKPEAAVDPHGPPGGDYRVLRGGAWCDHPDLCRAARRGWHCPGGRSTGLGFRLALDF